MVKTHRRIQRLFLAIVILTSCIGCDRVTKNIATQTLKDELPFSFCAGAIRFQYAQNPGGFLSFGENLPVSSRPWLFIGFNTAMMFALGLFLVFERKLHWISFVSVSFILAGGIGNLIDRVSNNGLVIDFVHIGIGPIRTGVFNVADMAVMFGGITLAFMLSKVPKISSEPMSNLPR